MTQQVERTFPFVVAVVLTWNDVEMTSRCIESVRANAYPRLGIVAVDNGSVPSVWPLLKHRFPTIDLVTIAENSGFTGGCNRGIERALALGADYVFLLNNDTIVHEQAIRQLVEVMEAQPDVGMASAILLIPGEEKHVTHDWGEIVRDQANIIRPDVIETLSDKHRRIYQADFVPACALMLRPKALREVGLFDESLFTNWEDYDMCCRFSDGGWHIVAVGTAEVVHVLGQTTGRISPYITYFSVRNRLICLFRYGKLSGILRHSITIIRYFYWRLRNHGWSNWPAHGAMLLGLIDFIFGVRGKGHVPSDLRDRKMPAPK